MDQYVRLKLLKLAPEIIKRSHTLQEIFYTQKFEKQTINSRWENRLMNVTFYGFVAIINGARIKIIIKEIAGGNKFFWSIIPFWKNKQKNSGENTTNKKILHTAEAGAGDFMLEVYSYLEMTSSACAHIAAGEKSSFSDGETEGLASLAGQAAAPSAEPKKE